ncbi:FAD-dependent oxidoreductase [Chloroflexota bacterium]
MQKGFYFDQSRCINCFTCCVACKDWHDVPAGPAKWIRMETIEEGEFPDLSVDFLATPCYHCAEPPCVAVCPAGAIAKREEDGIVVVDRERCRTEHGCGIIIGQNYREQQAPCKVACPVHVSAPGYIALIAAGKFKEACDLIRDRLALPNIIGRVCHHPCETVCKRQEVDEPIALCLLGRFIFDLTESKPIPVPRTKKERVAIIGSGPAGLGAAYELVKDGYGVTVYEALPVAGGMLAVGIPEYRLPKEILQCDIDYITGLGVEIKTNTRIGADLTLDDLNRQGYEAIFIAVGNHKGLTIGIPGEELDNVLDGVSFLKDVRLDNKAKVMGRVVIIGGGNVAVDAARSALRLGAQGATIVYRRSREEMPAIREEIEEAEREGVKIAYLAAPVRLLGKGGGVEKVECVRTELGKPDASGRRRPVPIKGSEFLIDADVVITAVGETADLSFLPHGDGFKLSETGAIAFNPDTQETSRPGIFAGGDVVGGVGYVIKAIASGQKAAEAIDRYLQGEVVKRNNHRDDMARALEIKVEIPEGVNRAERQNTPELSIEQRRHNFKETHEGFSEDAAILEAKRCLNCAGHLCLEVCPYMAPQFGDEENAKMQKCDLCLERWQEGKKPACVGACPTLALDSGPLEELKAKYGDRHEAVGFTYTPEFKPSVVHKLKVKSTQSVEAGPR